MEFAPTILSAIFGLGGVYLGYWLSERRSAERAKLDETFALHREFFGGSMVGCRSVADDILIDNIGKDWRELYEELPTDLSKNVFTLTNFYERLSVAASKDRLDAPTTAELFGGNFVYWYRLIFDKGLKPTSWPVRDRFKSLMEFFRKELGEAKISDLVKAADEEIARRVEARKKN